MNSLCSTEYISYTPVHPQPVTQLGPLCKLTYCPMPGTQRYPVHYNGEGLSNFTP